MAAGNCSLATVQWLKTVLTVFLLAFWLPATSHALMEHAGMIHTADSQHDDDHDAADGICVNATSHVQAPQPSLAVSVAPLAGFQLWLAICAVVDGSVPEPSGPAPPGVAPPELSQTWHFSLRMSLPARAPSYLS